MTRSTITLSNSSLPSDIAQEILFTMQRNKARYGSFRMEGGEDPAGGGDPQGGDDPAGGDDPQGGDDRKDLGFPPNTPVAEMTDAEEKAYWKHKARKHEDRNKALGDLTPEQFKEMRRKAEAHDALEQELRSDQEKALDAARKEGETAAEAAARSKFLPRILAAEFRAATSGKLDGDELQNVLRRTNMESFLKDDGEIDSEAVAEYAKPWAVAADPDPRRTGPSRVGVGRGNSHGGQSTGIAAGRELRRARNEKKNAS